MKHILKLTGIAMMALTLSNCKKDTKAPEPEPVTPIVVTPTGTMEVYFDGMVGDSDLVLSTNTYTNLAGNTYNITLVKYYISNIKLTKSDNSVWAESNSYHLVDHSNPISTVLSIANVPYGDYKALEFTIGVDSAKNVSGAQAGALDPANGMFWSWSSGYIMAKVEGVSPQSTASANKLTFHIGGFSGPNSVLKTISPVFPGTDVASVSSTVIPKIHLKTDVAEWFETPSAVDFSTLNTVHMPGVSAKTIADNYADMFRVDHIHN
jgi:hypothetical protein